MAHIYQAAIWCDECAEAVKENLEAEGVNGEDFTDESTYDSDDWPKDGGPDADLTPGECCDGCGRIYDPDFGGWETFDPETQEFNICESCNTHWLKTEWGDNTCCPSCSAPHEVKDDEDA